VGLRVVEVYEGEIGYEAPLIARELVGLGVGVAVVCPPRSVDAFADTGAQVIPLAIGNAVGSLTALRRVLRGDVVHAHGLRAALAVSWARPGAMPFVVSLTEAPRAAGAGAFVSRAVARSVVPAAAAVLVPTPELVETVTSLGARQVRLVPPPLPDPPVVERTREQVREELALPPELPIVLAAARLHPDARLEVLVDAAALWRRRDREPQVVLVGVGPAYRALVAQATVARAPVSFAGDRTVSTTGRRVSDTERTADTEANGPAAGASPDGEQPVTESIDERASLAELLAASTVAVVTDPRARAGFVLAAAQMGVPVVVPQGAVVAGLLGDAAVTVAPNSAEALDQAVRALLDGDRARLAAAVRARVADWPDARAAAGELLAIYAGVSRATVKDLADTPD
jgi:glycosyltransferase involved in cell wall biosynthesis